MTITSTHPPATDLGYLLHKNPARAQSFDLPFGEAHVFYPEATPERCTAALLLDVDPVGLVRGAGATLAQYVNDRPYVASSFTSVAISRVFGSALSGTCKDRPGLADTPIPLTARLAVLPCRDGEPLIRRLFEPLGYRVRATRHPLDETFEGWGGSPYFTVELSGGTRLQDLLEHLYVLVPVLDDAKHYFVSEDEVEKLLRRGGDWLAAHPEKALIADRYLKRQRGLVREALARLDVPEEPGGGGRREEALEAPLRLGEQRLGAVVAALKAARARRILDLGCGEGRLVRALLEDGSFEAVTGVDVSPRMLERARRALDRLPPARARRAKLLQGSLTYRDARLNGYDAAAVVEVVEHLDPPRLPAFERVLFGEARPGTVVLTTPNAEYNALFGDAGGKRHADHRFEWDRAAFRAWAEGVAGRHGYSVRFLPVGPEDREAGSPTQMAVFARGEGGRGNRGRGRAG